MTVPGGARWRQYSALLATYLRPQRARVALLAAVLVGDIGLQLVNPQILRAFINAARAGASDSTLATMAALFIVVVLATQAVSSLATYCSEGVGWTATNNLRADLTRHCLRLDASFHKQHSPGALLERVDGDVAVLSNFFSAFIVRVLGGALLLVGILALIAHEDWRVGLALTAYTALALWVLRRAQGLSVPAFKAWRQASADLSGFWEEHLSATEDLRSCGAEGYALARQDELMGALLRVNVTLTLLALAPLLIAGLVVTLVGGRLQRYRRASRAATGSVSAFLAETFGAVQTVQAAGAQEQIVERLRRLNAARRHAALRDSLFSINSLLSFMDNTAQIGVGVVLLLAGHLIRAGAFTVGDLALFIYLLPRVVDFTSLLGTNLILYRQAGVSLERLSALLPGMGMETLFTTEARRHGEDTEARRHGEDTEARRHGEGTEARRGHGGRE